MHQSHTLTGKVRVSILIPIGDVVRKTNAFGMILSSLDNAHFFDDRARLGKIPIPTGVTFSQSCKTSRF